MVSKSIYVKMYGCKEQWCVSKSSHSCASNFLLGQNTWVNSVHTLSMRALVEATFKTLHDYFWVEGSSVWASEIMSHRGLSVPSGHLCLGYDCPLLFLTRRLSFDREKGSRPGDCFCRSLWEAADRPHLHISVSLLLTEFCWPELPFLKNWTHDMWFLVNNDTASILTFSSH